MSASHHVIIGSGAAGSQAAATLRQREPDSKITMITMASLLFCNRYDLPRVFSGQHDWREYLVYPPAYYKDQRISMRRVSRVSHVDPHKKEIGLCHKETIRYDSLLVASGGRGHLPEDLAEYKPLMQGFATFEQAMTVYRSLPEGGHAILLGGDMIGLDLARSLVEAGYKVTLVANAYTFWPHEVPAGQRAEYIAGLTAMGIKVVEADAQGGIAALEKGASGMPARRLVFKDGSDIHGDVVMPFYGLVPSLEFMVGSGTDIERGLLVSRTLKTTDASIYAAGDVCQIWSDEDRRYRFFYGWKNVRAMGDVAARNMTGDAVEWVSTQDENLRIDNGRIASPFWEYN